MNLRSFAEQFRCASKLLFVIFIAKGLLPLHDLSANHKYGETPGKLSKGPHFVG